MSRSMPPPPPPGDPGLTDLQRVLDLEIPMCRQIGMQVLTVDSEGLTIAMPLDRNRNHQGTAFAGSLNALCTIAGWCTTYLTLRNVDLEGAIVIRRSAIKYHRPVESETIAAHCLPLSSESKLYFTEMLQQKEQAKLDLTVEIRGAKESDRPAVAFSGSYVVLASGGAKNLSFLS